MIFYSWPLHFQVISFVCKNDTWSVSVLALLVTQLLILECVRDIFHGIKHLFLLTVPSSGKNN